jgi:hypothetical protein
MMSRDALGNILRKGVAIVCIFGGVFAAVAYAVNASNNACDAKCEIEKTAIAMQDHDRRITRLETRFEYSIDLQEQILSEVRKKNP